MATVCLRKSHRLDHFLSRMHCGLPQTAFFPDAAALHAVMIKLIVVFTNDLVAALLLASGFYSSWEYSKFGNVYFPDVLPCRYRRSKRCITDTKDSVAKVMSGIVSYQLDRQNFSHRY